MLSTIIWTVVIVFILLVIIGGAIQNKEKAKLDAEKRVQLLAAHKQLRIEVLHEIESNKERISNYAEIEVKFNDMSTAKLGAFLEQFKRRYFFIEKYGEDEGEKLYNHQYWIGMTEEQLLEVKGTPTKLEIEALKTKTKRVLIYGNKSSGDIFTVVNGSVERFVDR